MMITESEIRELFPYEYVSGGWFRQKGVKKGQPAEEMVHGDQAIEEFVRRLVSALNFRGLLAKDARA